MDIAADTKRTLQKLVDDIAGALPADVVALIIPADDEIRYVVTNSTANIDHTEISMDDFRAGLCGRAFREVKPVLSPKNKPEPRESVKMNQWRADHNIGAVAVVPICIGETAAGTLAVMNRVDRRDFSEHDTKLLTIMANYAATVINDRLQWESQQQHISADEFVLRSSPHAAKLNKLSAFEQLHLFWEVIEKSINTVIITDTEGYIQYVNPKFTEITGYTAAEVLGQSVSILQGEELSAKENKVLWETIAQGHVWRGEFHNKRKDGTLYWEKVTITPIKNTTGQIDYYLAVQEDITRQKTAEMKLVNRIAELDVIMQVIMHIGAIIPQTSDVNELLQKMIDLIKNAFSLYHAHLYVLDNRELRLVVGAGEIGKRLVQEGWRIPLEHEYSAVARAARLAEPIMLNKVQHGTDFLQNPLLPHTRAELAVPLVIGGKVSGVLDVQADTVDFFSDDNIPAYVALGIQAAVVLRNARFSVRMQTALTEAESLHKISRTLNTITELPALLHSVAQMVAESLSATWTMLITVDMISNRIEQKTAVGPDAEDMLPETFDDLMASLSGRVLTQVQPLLSPKGEPDSRESLEQQQRRLRMGIGSIVIVPLHYHDKLLGVLGAINPMHGRDFTEQDVNLLTAIGNQAAAAIENRNLLVQSQKRAQREQAIREVTEKLRAAPNLDMLLKTAAEELGTRLGVRHSVLELGIDRPTVSETRQNPPENEDGESHV